MALYNIEFSIFCFLYFSFGIINSILFQDDNIFLHPQSHAHTSTCTQTYRIIYIYTYIQAQTYTNTHLETHTYTGTLWHSYLGF